MIETSRQGTIAIFQSPERLNADAAEEFEVVAEDCLAANVPLAVINLEGTQILDSAGLEFLVDFADQLKSQGGDLKLAAPNNLCAEILAITEVGSEIEVYKNVNQAVRSFVK